MLTKRGTAVLFVGTLGVVSLAMLAWLTIERPELPAANPTSSAPAQTSPARAASAQVEDPQATPTPATDRAAPSNSPSDTLARTTAQPQLTLEGFLASHFRSKNWDAPEPGKAGFGQDLAVVAGSTQFNPERKPVPEGKEDDLRQLIEKFDQTRRTQLMTEGAASKEAFAQAAMSGQYVATELPVVAGVEDRAGLQAYQKAQKEFGRRTIDDLTARLGKPLVDWAYSSVAHSQPDGKPRSCYVWVRRGDAPALFAARDAMEATRKEREAALQEFFRALP